MIGVSFSEGSWLPEWVPFERDDADLFGAKTFRGSFLKIF
jgi:hypothetical protein